MGVITLDSMYLGLPELAAVYLIKEGDETAFVDANTTLSVPRLLEGLSEAGCARESVRYIIITHAHLDHAGGAAALLDECPNAQLLAHPKAARHLISPARLVASAKGIYGEAKFAELYGEIAGIASSRVETVGDGEVLRWGSRDLTFMHTRGHANHHISIHDSGCDGVFAGDAFGLVYPWLQQDGLFALVSASPTDFDAVEALKSVDRILATGCRAVYLGHFGVIGELDAAAAQLRAQIKVYGALVDDAFASGEEGAGLEAMCQRRVKALFEDELLSARPRSSARHHWLETDIGLNAAGCVFAVKKRRFKASL